MNRHGMNWAMPWCILGVLALGLPACSSSEGTGGADAGPPQGTVVLRFSVTKEVRANPARVDPLVGTVSGSLFLSEDVGVTGPRDGVSSVADVHVEKVDVDKAEESTTSWKSDALEPQKYVFLGAFDIDGSGGTNGKPDSGDPVTLPTTNQFDVKADHETTLTVVFDLLYN